MSVGPRSPARQRVVGVLDHHALVGGQRGVVVPDARMLVEVALLRILICHGRLPRRRLQSVSLWATLATRRRDS